MSNKLISTLQTLLRMIVLAVLAVLIPQLIDNILPLLELPEYIHLILVAVLKSLDEYIHRSGVATPLDMAFLDGLKN